MKTTAPFLLTIRLIASLIMPAAPAFAQDSRAAAIAAEQAEKAKSLRPYQRSRAEEIITKATRGFVETPSGFYPTLGSVYSGGGFTLGAGYRHFYGDRSTVDARGLYSVKNYKLVELATNSPRHAGGRVDLYARTTWLDATRVNFYGLGPDSITENRTTFQLREGSVLGGLRVRPVRFVVLGAAVSYEDYTTTPSDPSRTPGPGDDETFVHSTASAGFDWRPSDGYARRGGLYEVRYHNYADRSDAFDFDRVDAEVVQHIPILRENWVVSLRGAVQTTLDGGVPYYLLPALGSGSTLRGYRSWRFRDRHSELFSAEWRWIPTRLALDMAVFYDTGKVASERRDLNFDGLKSDVGIGVRFHGPLSTPLRIELAHGSEGFHMIFSGGPAF